MGGGHGCHSATERMKELAAEKAADCSTSAFSEGNRHPIATLWATALQLSLDRSGYLFQHANKTGVAYPTANHWQYAHSPPHPPPLLHLRPAHLHSSLHFFSSFFFQVPLSAAYFCGQFLDTSPPLPLAHLKQMCAFEGNFLGTCLLPVVCQRAQWAEEKEAGGHRVIGLEEQEVETSYVSLQTGEDS